MIISSGRRFIFVHIPKTGGTSMALALEARAMADDILIGDTPKAQRRRRRLKGAQTAGRLWKHSTLRDAEGLIDRDQMRDYFVFTLVRNPWDRAVSYYHWLQDQTFDHPAVRVAQAHDFSDFLRFPEIQQSFRQGTYGSYVTAPDGHECANAFVRLEHLSADLRPVEAHLGFAPVLPRANTSQRTTDYRPYYKPEDADLLGRLCAEDAARFGYTFEQ